MSSKTHITMKRILTTLTIIAAFVCGSSQMRAQCSASFLSTNQANGGVTFTSTSIGTTSTTVYYWSWGNSVTYTAMGAAGMYPNYTYTANGTYVVTLFILTSAPQCSASVQQTITI